MLFNVVAKNSADDTLVLTLGGDHSIGIGSVAGTLKAKPETAVIWVVRTRPCSMYTKRSCADILAAKHLHVNLTCFVWCIPLGQDAHADINTPEVSAHTQHRHSKHTHK